MKHLSYFLIAGMLAASFSACNEESVTTETFSYSLTYRSSKERQYTTRFFWKWSYNHIHSAYIQPIFS